MKLKLKLQNLFLLILVLFFNIGTILGLTTFYYSKHRKSFINSKLLNGYCWLFAFLFMVIYPIAFYIMLDDFKKESRSVTDLARNSTYIGNWMLCTIIYFNQTSDTIKSCDVYNRACIMFKKMIKDQHDASPISDVNFNLNYTFKCILKTSLLTVGFFFINILKFSFRVDGTLTIFEWILLIYLFLPSFIIILSSSRFYVATTYFLYLVMKNNQQIEATIEACRGLMLMSNIYGDKVYEYAAARLNDSSRHYSQLQQIFVDFNRLYAKYIVLILGFCITNVVFEVRQLQGKENMCTEFTNRNIYDSYAVKNSKILLFPYLAELVSYRHS